MDDLLDFTDVRNGRELLNRTPSGSQVAELAGKLGLVNVEALNTVINRKQFDTKASDLSAPRLSDAQSYWASEYGRIAELIGVLSGQEQYLVASAKLARARARARVARELDEQTNTEFAASSAAAQAEAEATNTKPKIVKPKTTTVSRVNDLAETDPQVLDADERLMLVKLLLESARAAEKATTMYLQVLSREISFRAAQMDAKIYG